MEVIRVYLARKRAIEIIRLEIMDQCLQTRTCTLRELAELALNLIEIRITFHQIYSIFTLHHMRTTLRLAINEEQHPDKIRRKNNLSFYFRAKFGTNFVSRMIMR